MKVEVEEYNPFWADDFQNYKRELEGVLGDTPYLSIEHVGSTSVPGLAAKPRLDVDIVITKEQLPAVIEALTGKGGYEYRGEMGINDRHMFIKHVIPRRNLYACIEGSQALRNHLAIRDVCRRDPEAREVYAQKKRELAQKEWKDVDEYSEAKNDVIQWILEKAGGFDAADFESLREQNAWRPT